MRNKKDSKITAEVKKGDQKYKASHCEGNGGQEEEEQVEYISDVEDAHESSGRLPKDLEVEEEEEEFPVENQWVLEEAPTVTHQEKPIVVDLTEEFNRIFVRTAFNSFKEFETLFNQFKRETGSVFRIKSSCSVNYENSRRKRHFVPARFKFVLLRYCCVHYGQPKVAGHGIRTNQRYLPCGCESVLSVSYNRGALVITQVVMQHNHEVSSEMAPYYAINRRISNSEINQVADVIELMPSSRSLQLFLQEHFKRPITRQDAKNIRARLKNLQPCHLTISGVTSLRSRSRVEEEVEEEEEDEEDAEERWKAQVESIREEVVVGECRDEDAERRRSRPQEEPRQPTWKEKVVDEIKAKLSDLMNSCDANVFWERISVINKIIECWENGDNFDVHYNGGGDPPTRKGSEPARRRRGAAPPPPGRPGRAPGTNTALAGASDLQSNFMLPVLSGSDMRFLPASLNGQSLRLMLPQSKPAVPKRRPGRPRKYPLPEDGGRGTRDGPSPQRPAAEVGGRDPECRGVAPPSGAGSSPRVREPVVVSVTKGSEEDPNDQEMEVEIEINDDMVFVKQVKLEPLEYHEIDFNEYTPKFG